MSNKLLKRLFFSEKNYIQLLLEKNQSYFDKAAILDKLGLYKSILISPKYKNTYPYITSLYAYGYHDQAKIALERYKLTSDFHKNKMALIISILPFDKMTAYSLLKGNNTDLLLKANTLAAMNEREKLADLLSSLAAGDFYKKPELYLLNNFVHTNPIVQLHNLNKYLEHFNLDKLELVNSNNHLSVTNIKTKERKVSTSFNTEAPLISIIVTTYNSQEYIVPTLISLINQTYPNKEIVIVDDHSNDNTLEIIQKMMADHSCIRLISLKHNVGTYVAKTIGTYLAKGEFVINHDSDDWAHPQKIELQIEPLLKNPKLVVSFSKWVRLKEDGTFYARSVSPLTRLNPASALFRKKEVIEKTGLWNFVRTGADSEFNARLKLVFKNKHITINKPLTIGAHRENSLMTSVETGYSPDGKSLTRLLYWESWNYWHINSIKDNLPLIMKQSLNAPFIVPKEIEVNKEDILNCFKQFNLNIF